MTRHMERLGIPGEPPMNLPIRAWQVVDRLLFASNSLEIKIIEHGGSGARHKTIHEGGSWYMKFDNEKDADQAKEFLDRQNTKKFSEMSGLPSRLPDWIEAALD